MYMIVKTSFEGVKYIDMEEKTLDDIMLLTYFWNALGGYEIIRFVTKEALENA